MLCTGCAQEPADEPVTSVKKPMPSQPTAKPTDNSELAIPYVPNGGNEQQLDLYWPLSNDARRPLIIFIHGGAWIGGDKQQHIPLAHRFVADGFAVAAVNYRISPAVKNPTHPQDVALAYAWLTKHSGKRFDPTKIFLMGHSAGAHNAGMLASSDFLEKTGVAHDDLPKGYIGLEGIYDIPNLIKVWPTYREWFIEKAFGPETAWSQGSPTRRPMVNRAPWLVIHSTQDELVDLAQSRDFAGHLKKSGIAVQLNDKATGSHDMVVNNLFDPANPVVAEIEAFIRKHS